MVAGMLLPPSCREEILGDLCERYASPGQYFREALRVAVLVNLSRIRRTTDPQVLLMEALLAYGSFLGAAWLLDRTFLDNEWGLLRLAVAPAITLVFLMFYDAWAAPGAGTPLRSAVGVAIGTGLGCLSQITTLPPQVDLLGGAITLVLVTAVRISFLPGPNFT